MRFFDMGANLSENAFKGIYNRDIQYHKEDLNEVLDRAHSVGVDKMIIKGRTYEKMEKSLQLSRLNRNYFTCIGMHPTRTFRKEFLTEDMFTHQTKLRQLVEKAGDKCAAIGECGLDYSKSINYNNVDIKWAQQELLKYQLELAKKHNKPLLFIVKGGAEKDFLDIIENNEHKFNKGCVLNFQGNSDIMKQYIKNGLHFGVTGLMGKTQEHLQMLKQLPLDKIIIESNAPYCSISEVYEGSKYVKTEPEVFSRHKFQRGLQVLGRNEPCNLKQLVEMIAGVKELDYEFTAQKIYENTLNFFDLNTRGEKLDQSELKEISSKQIFNNDIVTINA